MEHDSCKDETKINLYQNEEKKEYREGKEELLNPKHTT